MNSGGRPRGDLLSLDRPWRVAQVWYHDRLVRNWRRNATQQVEAQFGELGLTFDIWRLSWEDKTTMGESTDYSINTNIRFGPLEIIDIPAMVEECAEPWFNQTLCKVNDSVIRLGILRGEFHWHKHEKEDEFFFVIDGQLLIDLENKTIELGVKQGYMIPKGIVHRTRAPEGVVVLMVEADGVVPTGD